MKQAPIPPDEPQRLAALYALKILDTPPEERFDRITRLARHLFNVPIAAITFIDTNWEWRKSCQGPPPQIPRAISFCAHAILDRATLVIADALLDERFADNPLVVGEPKIRFYSGHPLTAPDGSRVGTLCLIDHQPRRLSEPELALLTDMAAMVESELSLVEVVELQQQLSKANQKLKNEIAERKQAEEALRQGEERTRLIINTALDAVITMDTAGLITDWNTHAETIFGWSHQEAIGRRLSDTIIPGQYREAHQRGLKQFLATGEGPVLSKRIEITALHRDGHEFPIELSISPLRLGENIVFSAFVRDITKRKQAEEALRQSEQRFRQVVSSISDHIYVTEVIKEEHINLYLSPHVEPLTGYPLAKFIADWSFWPSTVIHPDDRAAAAVQAARLAMGQNSEIEYRLIRANGDIIWVRDSGRVEKDTVRQSLIVYGLVSDITERKQAEVALALAHDQALEASRLKTELLAKVSHELRTPLGVILGYTEMLEVDFYGPLSDKKRQMTAKIIDSTRYLTGLVNELLDQAQLEAGRLKLNIHPFTPAGLVDATLVKMSILAQAKELSLTSDIAADVPATLRGDAARLQQILVNLISNAIKFTPAGAVRLRLYCPDADHWALQVLDTGSGIPGEAQTYIFEPFRQVDGSVTRAHAGTGLGLSIVKQLTTLMGGEITLESEVGRGSTFTVSLPLQPIQEKTA